VEAAMSSDAKETLGQAYHMLAMERYWAADIPSGIAYSDLAIGVLAQSKKRYRLGLDYFTLALHTFINGDFASALQAAAQVQTIGSAIGDRQLQACAAWTTGWIETTRGDWEAGVAACQRSLDQLPDPLNRAFAMGALGYAFLEKGDTAEAVSLLQDAAHSMHQLQRHRLHGLYTTLLGKASLIQGDLDKAHDLALQGLTLCSETDYRFGVGWAQRVLGRIAWARGILTPAEQHVREALAIFTTLPARFEIGRTHLLLLELVHLQGRDEEAAKHAATALELFATSQAPKYLERTEHRIHELGIR
jgi:tetratricopeptide (TPR) repeat protein